MKLQEKTTVQHKHQEDFPGFYSIKTEVVYCSFNWTNEYKSVNTYHQGNDSCGKGWHTAGV